ncbi:hypothetical protein NIES4073_43930 [Kalymmatonema gypsitolerans NIES-4073]|nr:hypothetical protein NIES4073_43930 [Scytonema sp. NIES-4073]
MIQFLRRHLRTLIWFAVGLVCALLLATGFSFTRLTATATRPKHQGFSHTYTSHHDLTGRVIASADTKVPKVILISLDGATPRLVNQYLTDGILSPNKGLGLLQSRRVYYAATKGSRCAQVLCRQQPILCLW